MIPYAATAIDGMATLTGHLSARAFTYTTRDQTALTVNGRLVTNRALLASIERGYRPLLRKGRHPVVLCHLAVPSEWVDVNVHPAKAEVLLRHEAEIGRALREAIHAALGAAPAAALEAPPPVAARFRVQPALRFPHHRRTGGQPYGAAVSRLRESSSAYGQTSIAAPIIALAQLNDSLILARGADGALYLVDQHRAHERILYERIRASESLTGGVTDDVGGATTDDSASIAESSAESLTDGEPMSSTARESIEPGQLADDSGTFLSVVVGYRKEKPAHSIGQQLLLEPQLIELSPAQAAQLAPRLRELAALGLECQPFGGQVFLVRSVPSLPGAARSLAASVHELALAAAVDSDDWLDALRASLACRAAIRRGQSLTPAEQQALLSDLSDVSAPAVCPHGSPLILAYSPEFLANAFEW
jgi:DNA mismatch repair protein MutL